MPTIAELLISANLRTTSWLDQTSGEEKHGIFNPLRADPQGRYGNPDGLRVKDWPARNKAGAHAAGELSVVTPELAAKALGATPDPANDLADLDFVDGAAAFVLAQAKDKRLIDTPEPTTGTVPGPGPATPAPFRPLTDREVAEKTAAMAVQTLASLGRIETVLGALVQPSRTVVPGTSGSSLTALQTLKTRAAEIDSHHEDPKHKRYDALLAAVNTAIKDGDV